MRTIGRFVIGPAVLLVLLVSRPWLVRRTQRPGPPTVPSAGRPPRVSVGVGLDG